MTSGTHFDSERQPDGVQDLVDLRSVEAHPPPPHPALAQAVQLQGAVQTPLEQVPPEGQSVEDDHSRQPSPSYSPQVL